MSPSSQHPQPPSGHAPDVLPGRDLPINDPPPADGSQPPVQDPPNPHPDPTLQPRQPPDLRQTGPDTAESATAMDSDWADDPNPEAHESPV